MTQKQATDDINDIINNNNNNKCDECDCNNASFKCGGCKQVFYCNRKCQRVGWKSGHKKICKYASELESIYKQLSIDFEFTTQNRKSNIIKKCTPLQFKKLALNAIICWYDQDKDKGLNFDEFQEMMKSLDSSRIVKSNQNTRCHDENWSKWCDLCKKFGFDDPSKAILKEDEIWTVLLEIGGIVAMLRVKEYPDDESTITGYQQGYHLLVTLFNEIRDQNVAPIPKQDICDSIMSVTDLSKDITFIIHAYLSEIDAIFKIGKDKYCVEWLHDPEYSKPLHIMLQKYKEKAMKTKKDDNDDDYKKDNNLYKYHVSYVRDIQDAFYSDGSLAGDSDTIEVSVRISDEFGIIDKEMPWKKHTFLLGTCLSAKISCVFGAKCHAELISSVLKHNGLDPMNINTMYIGKKVFGTKVVKEKKQTLMDTFNDMNGCKARLIDERTAGFLGIFSEDAYNCKTPPVKQNNNNNRQNMFDELLDGLFGSILGQ